MVTNFKSKRSAKIDRALRREKAKNAEDRNKAKVRARDKACRFPFCGCKRFRLALHVSHQEHKGMGGNPTGDRSQTAGMMFLCSARHRENHMSVDQHNIEWRQLSLDGADGPVAWYVRVAELPEDLRPAGWNPETGDPWLEVARERDNRIYDPLTPAQRDILAHLSKMMD